MSKLKWPLVAIGLPISFFLALAGPNAQETASLSLDRVPNEILVKFKDGSDRIIIQDVLSSLGARIVSYLGRETTTSQWSLTDRFTNSFLSDPYLFHIRIPENVNLDQSINFLRSLSDIIIYAEPNAIGHFMSYYPNDQYFNRLWGLFNTGQAGGTVGADIDAPSAWNIFSGNGSVIVGVLDTGVKYDHPDLVDNMWTNPGEIPNNGIDDDGNGFVDDVRGWNFVNNNNNPMDLDGHGTHAAGIIGARAGNTIGVVGVNWNTKIMPVKIGMDLVSARHGLEYAVANGASVTSNSYGWGQPYQPLYDAINMAKTAGRLFVAAAGNYEVPTQWYDNDVTPIYPANYDLDNIIVVLATDNNDNVASYSHYGHTSVDIGAPGGSGHLNNDGTDIYSTQKDGLYSYVAGTSFATPYVAGVAALVWGCRPDLTWAQVKNAIMQGATHKASLVGKCVSEGRLSAYGALSVYSPPGPTAPSNLNGLPNCSSITLTWRDNSTNEQGFKIERKSGLYWFPIGQVGPNVTTYIDSELPCGQLFNYRVYAYSQSGNSLYSQVFGTKTTPCPYCGGGLVLEVSSDKSSLEKGGIVTLTYVIRNVASLNVEGILLSDEQLGTIAENVSLMSGESRIFTRTVQLMESITDNVNAIGFVDDEGRSFRVERKSSITVAVNK